ncbi:MAG: hypothetical protein J2P41_11830, partial [Blastocatellia bacterium]|nr:hypothetical protein [Blastocatellia bacterium]
PETAAWQIISKNPDVMERIGSGLAKTILGSKAGDTDPWADVAMEAIRSGQAVGIVREAINAFFSGINGLFPKGNQNGQAPAGPPQVPAPPNQNGFPQATPTSVWNQAPANAEGPASRPVQESAGVDQTNPALQQVVMTPADTLIIQLIQAMERNAPLKEAQSVIEVAIFRNPELGESVDELLNMSTESIMTLLGGYHPKVSEIPHAKKWLKSLMGSLASSEQEPAE